MPIFRYFRTYFEDLLWAYGVYFQDYSKMICEVLKPKWKSAWEIPRIIYHTHIKRLTLRELILVALTLFWKKRIKLKCFMLIFDQIHYQHLIHASQFFLKPQTKTSIFYRPTEKSTIEMIQEL